MSKLLELYRCPATGDIVKVTSPGSGPAGSLCPGSGCEWQFLSEQTEPEGIGAEHVPVIERIKDGIKVRIGTRPHPMIPDHYIEWVEVRKGPYLYIQKLEPFGPPEATFPIRDTGVKVRILCNLHDLWTNKK